MGNERTIKQFRGQMRQLVKETLPVVLTVELVESIRKELSQRIDHHFETLSKSLKTTLDAVDARSKATADLLVRSTTPAAPVVTEPTKEQV